MKRFLVVAAIALVPAAAAIAHSDTQRDSQRQMSFDVTPSPPRGNFTFAEAEEFGQFPLYFGGDAVAGLPLVAVHRIDAAPYPGEKVRRNDVTFVYGDCHAPTGPCAPPLQIQVWDACERYQRLYDILWDEATIIRGVPSAFYDDYMRLELYTGRVSIVIFAGSRDSRELLVSAARSLRGVNNRLAPGSDLPRPIPGVIDGKLPCQASR